MVLMATLTHRSTDCLGGRLRRDAFRRYPSRGVCAAATSDSKQTRPAAHGRHRGRKPRHAAASTGQPQKRAMENVVIMKNLKRGEQAVPKSDTTVTTPAVVATPVAQAGKAEPVAATGQLGARRVSGTAAAADQCGEPSEKVETVESAAADDRCPAPTEKAEKASPTKIETKTVTSADRCRVQAVGGAGRRTAQVKKAVDMAAADRFAEPVKAEAVAAANRIVPKARKAEAAPTVYAGASFVVSPDPCELPIPVALFKPRGARTAACA